jgi:hypothetical protein
MDAARQWGRRSLLAGVLACPALAPAEPAPAPPPPSPTFKSLGLPPRLKAYVAGSLTWSREGGERIGGVGIVGLYKDLVFPPLSPFGVSAEGYAGRVGSAGSDSAAWDGGVRFLATTAPLPERRRRLERAHGEGRLPSRLSTAAVSSAPEAISASSGCRGVATRSTSVSRSRSSRDYHVLWVHSFAGRVGGAPDPVAHAVSTQGYLKAMAARIREYDATGRLPAFLLFQTDFFYEGGSRLYLSLLEDPLGCHLRLGEGQGKLETEVREAQEDLRRAVASSTRLQKTPPPGTENSIYYLTVGSKNQNPRSAFLDGETSLVVAGPWALFGYSDFILLTAATTWVENAAELKELIPVDKEKARRRGRQFGDVL